MQVSAPQSNAQEVPAVRACPRIEKCHYFSEHFRRMPAFAMLYKTRYCLDAYTECAHYRVKQKLAAAVELAPPPVEEERAPHDLSRR